MKTTPLLWAALLLAACNSKPAAEKQIIADVAIPAETPVDPYFKAFMSKFRLLQLPLTIRPMELGDINNLPLLYGKDTNYITAPGTDTSIYRLYAYGLLADTANSYKLIWLSPADDYCPVLVTYTKKGEKISEGGLTAAGCGSDCCWECNQTISISKELSIYSADSIKTCECDDNGPKPETMRKYTMVKTAKIEADGKFKFTELVEKNY
ncbi:MULTISPECIES: hypothetical protein [Niastella]|uniref:Lipoprotein n=1 Tax=Niastella soli TaxID=2821487 RepID=A0ABS3Z2Z7_9BACT|nr:hypothetical protein [Niastella soli]MBO9204547.1 hypothetical protein [Niastella soli]